MCNTQLLDDAITNSGIKIGFICDKLGISRTAFDNKKNNRSKFKVAEVYVVCDLLGLNDSEKSSIFDPKS